MHVCVCVCARVRECACVRSCVRTCVCVFSYLICTYVYVSNIHLVYFKEYTEFLFRQCFDKMDTHNFLLICLCIADGRL